MLNLLALAELILQERIVITESTRLERIIQILLRRQEHIVLKIVLPLQELIHQDQVLQTEPIHQDLILHLITEVTHLDQTHLAEAIPRDQVVLQEAAEDLIEEDKI